MKTEITREWCFANAAGYMLFGDMDKPFHRPECECEQCEQWRRQKGRATHAELQGEAGGER